MGEDTITASVGEVTTAPRGLVIATVVLNGIALLFWVLTFFLPPLGFVGFACAIVASILACVLPCQESSGDEFDVAIKRLVRTHIAYGGTYIISISLTVAWWYAENPYSGATAQTVSGLGIAAIVFSFVTLALLITCLVFGSLLLCKIPVH